jgi:hypothetical protein
MYKRKWFRGILFLFVILLTFGNIVFFNNNQQTVLFHENDSFSNSQISVNVDGVAQDKLPDKNSGKAVSSIVCDKGATGVWDYYHWTINIKNMTSTRTRCQINFVSKYNEPLLNGTDPVLSEGLIPVTIDNNGIVKKASLGSKWYSYQEKQWANAVILLDSSIVYADGETIPESNIESYFVWIPRYKYKIFNDGNYPTQTGTLTNNTLPSKAQEIEVIFENKNTSVSNGSTVGSFLTHPAFTSFDTNGMWVGKFETGYKGSTSKESAEKNVNEPGSVQIKPNVNSWRSIQVANAFYTSYDYKRDYNSHMMKNTEWGAVAYLSHSKYGNMSSVRINNNSNYVTGYASVKEPTCGYTGTNEECNKYGAESSVTQPYNTSVGYLASTTGNISGVYDMSGGAIDYVMGVLIDVDGKPISGRSNKYNSGFNGRFKCPTCENDTSGLTELTTGINFPSDTRYYDTYAYADNDETYTRRILGDATGEMGPFATATYGIQNRQIGSWYADESTFIYSTQPWFGRGEYFILGSSAGVFSFVPLHGSTWDNLAFRIVLCI